MSSLLALLSQQTPNLQTRKGLILLGLQNDFLAPDGKLPVSTESGFLDRLKELVPAYREFGPVIWVRSEFESNRDPSALDEDGCNVITSKTEASRKAAAQNSEEGSPAPSKKRKAASEPAREVEPEAEQVANSNKKQTQQHSEETESADADDEELFLSKTATREPCCIRNTPGADYATQIKDLVDSKKDMELVKTFYSAFSSTSLLLTLRSKLITELFVCGCNTNLSVYATAMDAARYGIKITLVSDCLGYRKRERHNLAVKRLVEIMNADVMTSKRVIDLLKNPPVEDDDDEDESSDEEEEQEVEAVEKADASVQKQSLEVDSDDEEEETELPTVRPLSLTGRQLQLRYKSLRDPRSPMVGAATSRSNSSQHAKPESSQPTKSDRTPVETRRSNRDGAPGPRGSVKPGVKAAGGDSTVDRSDSSEPSRRQEPWLSVIDSSRPGLPREVQQASSPKHPGLAGLSAAAGLDQRTTNEYEAAMLRAQRERSASEERPRQQEQPLFGKGKEQESAGSRILYDLLPCELAQTVFGKLKDEVSWQKMHHQTGEVPRLVCCQGTIGDDGSMPVYRHPSDQTLPLVAWSPTVEQVRQAAEKVVSHPLNHVLIQLYRGGNDYISEHSDKTLDIVRGSNIVNVSIGAQRTMRLRTKRAKAASDTEPPAQRTTYRIPMPHNSMIAMSLATNAEYLHGINADKRPAVELTEAEKAFDGQRISLTFRQIGTFLSADSKLIWGQGAVATSREKARPTINGDAEESEKMVRAFGAENQSTTFDWDVVYGKGFNVLHLK